MMACSPARRAANQQNALQSTGPQTPEGKESSRRNALKHGMTGAGVVLLAEDAAEVDRRAGALMAEMDPRGEMGRLLVDRMATLSVRMERCVRHENAAMAERVRHAEGRFDDSRLAEVEKAFSWIASEPATQARRLRATPEGVDLLIRSLVALRDELAHPNGCHWDWFHSERFHSIMGLRHLDVPATRARALSEAIEGNFEHLRTDDAPDLDREERRVWAAVRMIELIEAEADKLRAHRETLDTRSIDLDRAEAGDRVLFDDSREATNARKYEAAAERGLYRAIREFKEAQARADEASAPDDAYPADDETSGAEDGDDRPAMGSFFPRPPAPRRHAPDGPGAARKGRRRPPPPSSRRR